MAIVGGILLLETSAVRDDGGQDKQRVNVMYVHAMNAQDLGGSNVLPTPAHRDGNDANELLIPKSAQIGLDAEDTAIIIALNAGEATYTIIGQEFDSPIVVATIQASLRATWAALEAQALKLVTERFEHSGTWTTPT